MVENFTDEQVFQFLSNQEKDDFDVQQIYTNGDNECLKHFMVANYFKSMEYLLTHLSKNKDLNR